MNDRPSNVHQLKNSVQYRVRRAFTDYYGNQFNEGEILTFMHFNFLPYHGGYTIVFQEKTLYLQEEQNAAILESFGDYFIPLVK